MSISETTLLRYVANVATVDEIIEVDEQMALDPQLLSEVRGLLLLRDRFEVIWKAFPAGRHAAGSQKSGMAEALAAVAGRYPDLSAKLRGWWARAGQGPSACVRVLLDGAKVVATLAAESLPAQLSASLRLQFGGVGSPDQVLEAHLHAGSDALQRGEIALASRELESAAAIDRRHAESANLSIRAEGRVVIEVLVTSRRRSVGLRCLLAPDLPLPTHAVLIPDSSPEAALVVPFERMEGDKIAIAEILDVPDGAARLLVLT